MLALGALGSGVAYVLNYHVIDAAGGTTASTVTYLTPIVAVVVGLLFLGEHVSLNQPIGGAIALAGIALSQGRLRSLAGIEADGPRSALSCAIVCWTIAISCP